VNPLDLPELHLLRGGRRAIVRPLARQDAPLLEAFVRGLSPRSRRRRFLNGIAELTPELLALLLDVDQRERAALVALGTEEGADRIVGEARYAPSMDDPGAADVALVVADDWQRRGLGTLLLGTLLGHAESQGVSRLHGDVLHENTDTLRLLRRFGFAARRHPDGAWLARMELALPSARWRTIGAFRDWTAADESALRPDPAARDRGGRDARPAL
jgi:acetyltransferase